MALSTKEIRKLRRIIALAEALIAKSEKPRLGRPPLKKEKGTSGKRIRRSGKQLAAFRKMLKAERQKGVPVAELAKKHQVSTAYVYQVS